MKLSRIERRRMKLQEAFRIGQPLPQLLPTPEKNFHPDYNEFERELARQVRAETLDMNITQETRH